MIIAFTLKEAYRIIPFFYANDNYYESGLADMAGIHD
jgi:hypothetical protein